MNRYIKRVLYGICVTVVLLFIGLLFITNFAKNQNANNLDRFTEVSVGKLVLKAEVADTDAKRTLGLSQRTKLSEDKALLFVFETEGKYGFWMKDMLFPINIYWLDSNKQVVHIENHVSPSSYPKVYYPTDSALYVLETNTNIPELQKIKIGDKLKF